MGLWYRLLRLAAEILDLLHHITALGETDVVRTDEAAERWSLQGELYNLTVVGNFPALQPLAPAFLQDPQAYEILEEASRARKADFVRILSFS